jgi:hypothetical protein
MAAQRGGGDPIGDGLLFGVEIRAERKDAKSKDNDSGGQKKRTAHTSIVPAGLKTRASGVWL